MNNQQEQAASLSQTISQLQTQLHKQEESHHLHVNHVQTQNQALTAKLDLQMRQMQVLERQKQEDAKKHDSNAKIYQQDKERLQKQVEHLSQQVQQTLLEKELLTKRVDQGQQKDEQFQQTKVQFQHLQGMKQQKTKFQKTHVCTTSIKSQCSQKRIHE